ncbi:MAG: Do family serine endopeptidase [Candidatus Omnitrophica bacterium]|nr:Do family serine endopeptidase [Candidatus Omnitrophota bacterium]
MKKKFIYLSAVISGLIIGLLISACFNFSPSGQTEPPTYGSDFQDAVVRVADTTGKAVVSISTECKQRIGGFQHHFGGSFGNQFFGDEFFQRFFEDFFGDIPEREFKQRGLGSGVIIDPEGYILTNEHVVHRADKISVTLPDGRKFTAELKGKDVRSDLAIIKIEAHNLPVARLGDSERLRIGDWVIAFGNPFGFALDNPEPTVTVGVISALHRSLGRMLSQERDYSNLIQTDAAINPGNSGGPLVNLEGEIIGINVAIFSTSGGYQGIGFAIPINNAKRILSRLVEGKKILYGWLGVTIQDLNQDLAAHFGLSDREGVLVASVLEDGPADKAGFQPGDIIKKFEGKDIKNVRQLISLVSQTPVGKKARILIFRDKKQKTLKVEIGERPEDLEQQAVAVSTDWRGLEVKELSEELKQHFRLTQDEGVIVVNVKSDSPAAEAGLVPGDIILEVNQIQISRLSDYQEALKDLKGDVLIRTQRGYFILKED